MVQGLLRLSLLHLSPRRGGITDLLFGTIRRDGDAARTGAHHGRCFLGDWTTALWCLRAAVFRRAAPLGMGVRNRAYRFGDNESMLVACLHPAPDFLD